MSDGRKTAGGSQRFSRSESGRGWRDAPRSRAQHLCRSYRARSFACGGCSRTGTLTAGVQTDGSENNSGAPPNGAPNHGASGGQDAPAPDGGGEPSEPSEGGGGAPSGSGAPSGGAGLGGGGAPCVPDPTQVSGCLSGAPAPAPAPAAGPPAPGPPAPPPAAVVARQALDAIQVRVPQPHTSPPEDRFQITGLPTWFWMDRARWRTVSARAELPHRHLASAHRRDRRRRPLHPHHRPPHRRPRAPTRHQLSPDPTRVGGRSHTHDQPHDDRSTPLNRRGPRAARRAPAPHGRRPRPRPWLRTAVRPTTPRPARR